MRSFLMLFLPLFCLNVTAQRTSAEMGVGAIGLVVSNIEKSEHFYCDILGMVPAGSFELSEEWSKEAGAANNRPFAVKMYKTVDTNTATVLKLAYFKEVAPRPDQTGVDSYAGVNYITLYYTTQGFLDVLTRLETSGLKKLGWVKREGYQLIFVKDPDGVFVELVGPPQE